MPFRKVGADDYVSPSGRHFSEKQVRLYYVTNGFQKQALKQMRKSRRKRK